MQSSQLAASRDLKVKEPSLHRVLTIVLIWKIGTGNWNFSTGSGIKRVLESLEVTLLICLVKEVDETRWFDDAPGTCSGFYRRCYRAPEGTCKTIFLSRAHDIGNYLLVPSGLRRGLRTITGTMLRFVDWFLPCDAMLARHMLWRCVCLCLCPSQVGVLPKRLNVGSHKQHHTITQGF